jgi:uncharacterized membrane protein
MPCGYYKFITPDEIMLTYDEKRTSALSHILGVFGCLPAILILLVRGKDSAFIHAHAMEAVTFQVNCIFMLALLMVLVPIGTPAPILLPFLIIYLTGIIYGTYKAVTGRLFYYRFIFHFLGKPKN